jgi:hypothetical protein
VAEVVGERAPRDLGDRTGELDARGAAADQDEREERPLLRRIALTLRSLERGQDPPPDLERVLDGLEAGRERRPGVVPEVRVRRAGREDEEVERQPIAVRDLNGARRQIDRRHVAEDHLGVGLPPQHAADRRGDVGRVQGGGRDLVQQRLEQVVVPAIHDASRACAITDWTSIVILPGPTLALAFHGRVVGSAPRPSRPARAKEHEGATGCLARALGNRQIATTTKDIG